MSAWSDLVSKIFKENKDKKQGYKLKDAMMDAKKVYKSEKGKATGKEQEQQESKPKAKTKKRKGKKSRKSRKSRKSSK
jgi:hypothetical protein